jgi:hypothetical protein
MNGLMIFLMVIGIAYIIGGFIYAGVNAMIDLNWAYKLYRSKRL